MSKKVKIDLLSVTLLVLAASILIVILAGTLWAFTSGNVQLRSTGNPTSHERSLFSRGVKNPAAESLLSIDASGETAVFPDLGTIRAPTADSQPVTVIITIYFPYPAKDSAFQEELVQKNRAIRRVVLEWFGSRTISKIDEMGESSVKADLLVGINKLLILGQIDVLYFSDYLVIE